MSIEITYFRESCFQPINVRYPFRIAERHVVRSDANKRAMFLVKPNCRTMVVAFLDVQDTLQSRVFG